MTSTGDDGSYPTDRQRSETPPAGGFRWTCPLCGKSNVNRVNDGSGKQNATAALRTHILATDGNGHGSRNEFPAEPGLDGLVLAEHVVRVNSAD